MGLPDSRMGPFSRLGGGWSDSSEGALSDSHRFTVTFSAWECPLCVLLVWALDGLGLQARNPNLYILENPELFGVWLVILHLPSGSSALWHNCRCAKLNNCRDAAATINSNPNQPPSHHRLHQSVQTSASHDSLLFWTACMFSGVWKWWWGRMCWWWWGRDKRCHNSAAHASPQTLGCHNGKATLHHSNDYKARHEHKAGYLGTFGHNTYYTYTLQLLERQL